MKWTIKRTDENVHQLRIPMRTGEKVTQLFISDVHLDNAHCDRDLLRRHLDQAGEVDAPIFIGGDWFDAMQAKRDRRKSYGEADPRHLTDTYFDDLVADTIKFIEPYKKLVCYWGYGNHETAVIKHAHTDLIQRTVQALRSQKSPVVAGGYDGWIQFVTENGRQNVFSKTLYYHHGNGAGGSVTEGKIDESRMARARCADIYWQGHIHRWNTGVRVLEQVDRLGKCEVRPQIFLRTSTYKREGYYGRMGFAKEKGMDLRPCGGYWLDWTMEYMTRPGDKYSLPYVHISERRTDMF